MLVHWWGVFRPWSFTASFVPIAFGAALASNEGKFDLYLLILTLLGGIAVHAGTNLMNSYGDYITGVDTIESASHLQLVSGILRPHQVKTAGWICFGLATIIGVFLFELRGWPVLFAGGLGVVFGYFYTMGPKPYKYYGLGPVVIFFLMGPCMVCPSYYIQTGKFSWLSVWAALPISFLISGFHHSNDMRDMKYDKEAGITTLALFIGRKNSMRLFYVLFIGAFISTIILLLLSAIPFTAALPLFLLPSLLKMFVDVRQSFWSEDKNLVSLEAIAAGFHFKYGMLLIIGTSLFPWLKRFIQVM